MTFYNILRDLKMLNIVSKELGVPEHNLYSCTDEILAQAFFKYTTRTQSFAEQICVTDNSGWTIGHCIARYMSEPILLDFFKHLSEQAPSVLQAVLTQTQEDGWTIGHMISKNVSKKPSISALFAYFDALKKLDSNRLSSLLTQATDKGGTIGHFIARNQTEVGLLSFFNLVIEYAPTILPALLMQTNKAGVSIGHYIAHNELHQLTHDSLRFYVRLVLEYLPDQLPSLLRQKNTQGWTIMGLIAKHQDQSLFLYYFQSIINKWPSLLSILLEDQNLVAVLKEDKNRSCFNEIFSGFNRSYFQALRQPQQPLDHNIQQNILTIGHIIAQENVDSDKLIDFFTNVIEFIPELLPFLLREFNSNGKNMVHLIAAHQPLTNLKYFFNLLVQTHFDQWQTLLTQPAKNGQNLGQIVVSRKDEEINHFFFQHVLEHSRDTLLNWLNRSETLLDAMTNTCRGELIYQIISDYAQRMDLKLTNKLKEKQFQRDTLNFIFTLEPETQLQALESILEPGSSLGSYFSLPQPKASCLRFICSKSKEDLMREDIIKRIRQLQPIHSVEEEVQSKEQHGQYKSCGQFF